MQEPAQGTSLERLVEWLITVITKLPKPDNVREEEEIFVTDVISVLNEENRQELALIVEATRELQAQPQWMAGVSLRDVILAILRYIAEQWQRTVDYVFAAFTAERSVVNLMQQA